MTYVATANAFIRAGWDIHIIDTDIHGLIDVNKIPKEDTNIINQLDTFKDLIYTTIYKLENLQ